MIDEITGLNLIPLKLSDVEHVYKLTSDPEVAQYMRFDTHTSLTQAENLIRECILDGNFAIAIRTRENNFAGIFVLKRTEKIGEYDISTFLGKQFWNMGYSQAILSYMKKYAKQKFDATALFAYVVADNIGSCTVLLKNEFVLDHIIQIDLPCGLNVYKLTI